MSWCHTFSVTSVILVDSEYITGSEYYVSAAHKEVHCSTTDQPCTDISNYTVHLASMMTQFLIS